MPQVNKPHHFKNPTNPLGFSCCFKNTHWVSLKRPKLPLGNACDPRWRVRFSARGGLTRWASWRPLKHFGQSAETKTALAGGIRKNVCFRSVSVSTNTKACKHMFLSLRWNMKSKLNDGECHTIHQSEDNMFAKCCMKLLLKDKQLSMVRWCDVTMSQPAAILEYSGSKFSCFIMTPSNHTRKYHRPYMMYKWYFHLSLALNLLSLLADGIFSLALHQFLKRAVKYLNLGKSNYSILGGFPY